MNIKNQFAGILSANKATTVNAAPAASVKPNQVTPVPIVDAEVEVIEDDDDPIPTPQPQPAPTPQPSAESVKVSSLRARLAAKRQSIADMQAAHAKEQIATTPITPKPQPAAPKATAQPAPKAAPKPAYKPRKAAPTTRAKVAPTPVNLPDPSTIKLKLVDYSEKCIAVFGDTKPIKDVIKQAGGRYNPSLHPGGCEEKVEGWVFPSKDREKVESALAKYL